MRLLDLYCGAGGATRGYQLAGFEVWGVDIKHQPHYCGERFQQMDVFEYLKRYGWDNFDAIHASPPCQRFSDLALRNKNQESYPDLIASTRKLLKQTKLPYIIENVERSPLIKPTILCGSMFNLHCTYEDGNYRQLRRHRLFETNFPIEKLSCVHKGQSIGVYGGGPQHKTKNYKKRGGYQGTQLEKQLAMNIDWMNRVEINEAIPPAYTQYIGEQLYNHQGFLPL